MTYESKRFVVQCDLNGDVRRFFFAAPDATVFRGRDTVMLPEYMHSARCWLLDPFDDQTPPVEVVLYHQPDRNGCPENPFGTQLLRQSCKEKLKGRRRTTAYGDIWLDFGLRDVLVFRAITAKVDFANPEECEAFASNMSEWFARCPFAVSLAGQGTIDLHVLPRQSVSAESLTTARMFWG